MAEEVETYNQVETGDPDPLGLEKKLQAVKSKADPLGLEAKLRSLKSEQQPKSEPQQPAFKPMTDWLGMGQSQGYQPLVPENAINEHNTKTAESSERVKAHLNDIDNSVKKLLYEHKKDLLGRVTSQNLATNPSEAGPVNFQAQQLAQKDRQDVYVSPAEVESFKSEMPNNALLMRRGLEQKAKDLAKTNPAEANSLKADIYRLDRQNNPEKENKIASNIDKINKGEYDYDIVNGQLVKPEGFFGSLATGYKEKVQAYDDYGVYKSGDEKTMLDLINKRLKHDPDQAVPVAEEGWISKSLAEMGRMAGGQPLKPILGGAAAGIAAGPEAGVAAATAITAPEMYKLTFGATLPQNYAAIKKQHPDWSDSQVLQESVDFTHNQANIDALSGAAMGVLGAKVGLQPTGLNRGLLQKSLGNAMKQVGQESVKKTLEGLGVGAVGASGQLVKNLMAQQEGLPVDASEGLKEQLIGGLKMTMGMTMLAKFPEALQPKTYNQILQAFKNVPKEAVEGELNNLQQAGQITEDQANNAQKAIKEHADIDNSIKPNVPESDRLKVQQKIKQRNNLDASLETEDKAYHTDTKEQIKALNEDINRISKGEERGDLQKLVDKEHKDGNLQGFVTETLRNANENDLKKYFKEISEQAHDPNSEATTIATFGENIVNKAKELYPDRSNKSKLEIIEEDRTSDLKEIDDKIEKAIKETYPTSKRVEYLKRDRDDINAYYDNQIKSLPKEEPNKSIAVTYPKKTGNETTIDGVTLIKPEQSPLNAVSVIKPGEINRPETITIKPQENAIPIGSSEKVHVGEAPGNSQEMGAGIPESGEASGAQEGRPIQEEGKGTGKEGVAPPMSPSEGKGIYVEQPTTQLSFRGLQEVANEFGYEDVKSRDRVSDIQERKNAEVTANEWAQNGEYQKNIDDLLDRIEKREHVPTAKQRLILEQYLANERQKAREMPKNSAEYDRQLSKLQRIKDIGQIARQEAGAALRLPNEGTLPHPITDETSAMIAKMEANSVDKLTDQQKAEVEAQVAKHKQATDEANAKIAALEEQVAKLDAQKEFNKAKSTTKRIKKTSEERAAFRRKEVEAAREALQKLRSGESGLSAVPLPGVRELMAIAPHVKNIMVDLVAQGVDNLQDVISHLHTEFKDVLEGLTEKNIHDIIAGEYNEPSRPLSEMQRQVRDLQEEAKLINQVEALENGVEPKTEKAKRERNEKIKALRDKIKGLKKEDGAEELMAIKKRNEAQVKKIQDKIQKGEFEKETKKSIFDREDIKQRYPKLRKEALDAIAKKEEAQHEFDLALFNDEMAKRKWYQKAASFGGKLIHTSKAVMSGIDDSATFVQNGLAMLANPKIGTRAFIEHWKDAFSDARFKRELAALHQRPDWEVIKNSGLDIVEPHSAASKQVEEAFEQNLLAQIKIKGIKPWDYTGGIFERAFTSMGNNMRLLLFEKQMAALKDEGKTFERHPEEYKDAARAINELTGRGQLPAGIAQASPYITPFIWAPRMLTSTINTLGLSDLVLGIKGKGYYQNLTPMQRRFALGQLGRGVGIGVAVMGAAALGGAKVDYDPRSVTFGDVIIGDHHYNVFGRFTPVIKTIVQASLGTRIKGGGQEQDLDSGKFGAKTRLDVVGGFFRGKTTPFVGSMMNLAEGKNYFTNEPFTIKDLPASLLQPMSIKELRDGWKNDGTMTLLNRFLPAFEGLKTSDERDFNKSGGGSTGGAGATGRTVSREKPTRVTRTNPHQKH